MKHSLASGIDRPKVWDRHNYEVGLPSSQSISASLVIHSFGLFPRTSSKLLVKVLNRTGSEASHHNDHLGSTCCWFTEESPNYMLSVGCGCPKSKDCSISGSHQTPKRDLAKPFWEILFWLWIISTFSSKYQRRVFSRICLKIKVGCHFSPRAY